MTPLKTLIQQAIARSQRKRPKRSDAQLFERYVPKAVDDFLRKLK